MNWWIPIGAAGVVLLGFLASRHGWIDLSNKNNRSGSGSSVLGIGDEVFAPTRHEAAIELDRQTVLPAPAPVAGDGDLGLYDGRISITIDDDVNTPDGAPRDPGAAGSDAGGSRPPVSS